MNDRIWQTGVKRATQDDMEFDLSIHSSSTSRATRGMLLREPAELSIVDTSYGSPHSSPDILPSSNPSPASPALQTASPRFTSPSSVSSISRSVFPRVEGQSVTGDDGEVRSGEVVSGLKGTKTDRYVSAIGINNLHSKMNAVSQAMDFVSETDGD